MKAILWQCEYIFWVRPLSRLNKSNLSIKYIKNIVNFRISSSEILFTSLCMCRMMFEKTVRYSSFIAKLITIHKDM